MSGWILQKNGYEPAALNVSPPVSPLLRRAVVQAVSSFSVAVCAAESPLVQAITSPTLAWTVAGTNVNSDMAAATVPASLDGVHAAVPPPGSADAGAGTDAAGGSVAGAVVVAGPPEQAARVNATLIARMVRERRDMASSLVWSGASSSYVVRYVNRGRLVLADGT